MILLIHGPPASGKTTLASRLANDLNLPYISRDQISEWTTDSIPNHSTIEPRFISDIGYELMFRFCGELTRSKSNFIIEGCLNPNKGGDRVNKVLGQRVNEASEIFLTAPHDVLVERYKARIESGSRHPAHNDNIERLTRLPSHLEATNYRPFKITSNWIEYDTYDGSYSVDAVVRWINKMKESRINE